MKGRILLPAMASLILIGATYSFGQKQSEDEPRPHIISTYECAGIYWQIQEDGACKIKYKEITDDQWREGLDLVYDAREGEYRGSMVGLRPNTSYQVELSVQSSKTMLDFKTRNDQFPIGKVTLLPAAESDRPIVITESGTP